MPTSDNNESALPANKPTRERDAKAQAYLDEAVRQAAGHSWAPSLEEALKNGGDPKAASPKSNKTALMMAAETGNSRALKTLLPLSEPNFQGAHGFNALMQAASAGRAKCMEALMPVTDLTAVSELGRTALHVATEWGNVECVSLLISRCDPDAQDHEGDNALMIAATSMAADEESEQLVRLLLGATKNLNAVNKRGETALFQASSIHSEMEAFLPLVGGIDANTKNEDGKTALIASLDRSAQETESAHAWKLLPVSDWNLADNDGLTAFDHAASNGHWDIADFMAEKAPREKVDAAFQWSGKHKMPRWAAWLEAEEMAAAIGLSKPKGAGDEASGNARSRTLDEGDANRASRRAPKTL